MRTFVTFPVEFDGDRTDAESVAAALDTLLETALSTPGILDEYGPVDVGPSTVTDRAPATHPAARRFLDLSTAHIPADVAATADAGDGLINAGDLRVTNHAYGWFVHLPGDREDCDGADWFAPIADMAFDQGCDLVMFDVDGPEAESLPRYIW